MPLNTLLLVLASVVMSTSAQFALKTGMSARPVQAALESGSWAAVAGAVLLRPAILLGLALYGLGAVAWLFVLAKLDLSAAYPLLGMGFIATFLVGVFLLNETASPSRTAGTLLVAAGVALVARR